MENILVANKYRTPFIKWYKSLDIVMLSSFFALIAMGIILIISVGDALKLNQGILYHILPREWVLASKQIIFVCLSLGITIALSALDLKSMRRVGIGLYVLCLPFLFMTLFMPAKGGASRWFLGIQPSEFIKPAFIIVSAWLMTIPSQSKYLSGTTLSLVALLVPVMIIYKQPDVGQTILLCSAWAIMFFVSGANLLKILMILPVTFLGGYVTYLFKPHFQRRIDSFIHQILYSEKKDITGEDYQSHRAEESFKNGGLLGQGPGEGEMKFRLPEAHNDYIYAVAGEEFGVILCWFIIFLFMLITVRLLWKLTYSQNKFILIAGSGLASAFAIQALIHIGVNTGLLPSKGMTLPFVSYGGSSMLAIGISAGFMLCISKKNNNI